MNPSLLKPGLAACAVVLCCACGSVPTTHYYLLEVSTIAPRFGQNQKRETAD